MGLISVLGNNHLQDKPYWKRAFIPYFRNPGGLNLDAIITLIGLAVWVIVTLGTAFGVAQPLPEVQQIGSMLFGVGMGRASKNG